MLLLHPAPLCSSLHPPSTSRTGTHRAQHGGTERAREKRVKYLAESNLQKSLIGPSNQEAERTEKKMLVMVRTVRLSAPPLPLQPRRDCAEQPPHPRSTAARLALLLRPRTPRGHQAEAGVFSTWKDLWRTRLAPQRQKGAPACKLSALLPQPRCQAALHAAGPLHCSETHWGHINP